MSHKPLPSSGIEGKFATYFGGVNLQMPHFAVITPYLDSTSATQIHPTFLRIGMALRAVHTAVCGPCLHACRALGAGLSRPVPCRVAPPADHPFPPKQPLQFCITHRRRRCSRRHHHRCATVAIAAAAVATGHDHGATMPARLASNKSCSRQSKIVLQHTVLRILFHEPANSLLPFKQPGMMPTEEIE